MFLPSQTNLLRQVAMEASLAARKVSPEKRFHRLRVGLLDPIAIKPYFAACLSQGKHFEPQKSISPTLRGAVIPFTNAEKNTAENFAKDNPLAVSTFQIISAVLAEYCNDMKLATAQKYEEASDEAGGLDAEASTESMPRELLPHMALLLSAGNNEGGLTAEDFTLGLKYAYERKAFGETIGCPFGRKAASIFAMKPVRISESEVIISDEKERGALPAFILREIQTYPHLQVEQPHTPEPEGTEAVIT